MKSHRTSPHHWDELTNESLDKLVANRLFGLRDKMNKIISKISTDIELTEEHKKLATEKAIIYKNKVLHRLAKFGHIEK
jgi:hypothetical protein